MSVPNGSVEFGLAEQSFRGSRDTMWGLVSIDAIGAIRHIDRFQAYDFARQYSQDWSFLHWTSQSFLCYDDNNSRVSLSRLQIHFPTIEVEKHFGPSTNLIPLSSSISVEFEHTSFLFERLAYYQIHWYYLGLSKLRSISGHAVHSIIHNFQLYSVIRNTVPAARLPVKPVRNKVIRCAMAADAVLFML